MNYRWNYRDCSELRNRKRARRILGALFLAIVFGAMLVFALS